MTAATSTALALVKSPGRGRPPSEEAARKREETRAKLESWGLFKETKDRRSKAFDSWSVKDCESALKWARKQVQINGGMLDTPGSSPAGKVAPDVATPPTEAGPEIVKACGRVVDPFILDPASWVLPYAFEVLAWSEAFRLRDKVAELEQELAEAFGDIQRLMALESFQASIKDIAIVAAIGNGGFVRGLVKKLSVVHADGKASGSSDWKGKTKVVFTSTFPRKEHDDDPNAVVITCEIKEDLPSMVCGGRMYVDDAGEFVKVDEAIKSLRLMSGDQAQ